MSGILGLSSKNLLTACQDTTASPANSFLDETNVGYLLCCSHTDELIKKHAVEKCYELKAGIESIENVFVRARRNEGAKRHIILENKCKEAGIGFLSISLINTIGK